MKLKNNELIDVITFYRLSRAWIGASAVEWLLKFLSNPRKLQPIGLLL